MEFSIVKDTNYGIVHDGKKFRDVRNKAIKEYQDRGKKKKKDKKIIIPKFLPGQEIVVVNHDYKKRSSKQYCLVEIIDFEIENNSCIYYSIVKETTSKSMLNRIGRLIIIEHNIWFSRFGWEYGNVKNENIKWLENKS